MQGYTIQEIHPCGVKPVMLLRRGGDWCVYRSRPRYFADEAAARRCMQCMIDHREKKHRDWMCPNEQQA